MVVWVFMPVSVAAEQEDTVQVYIPKPKNGPTLTVEELRDFRHQQELYKKAVSLVGSYQGQCVIAVRSFLGIGRDQIQGWARSTKVNSQIAEIGSIIVLNMSVYGHVGVVIKQNEHTITYYDSNGGWRGRAAIRTINKNSPKIIGYRLVK